MYQNRTSQPQFPHRALRLATAASVAAASVVLGAVPAAVADSGAEQEQVTLRGNGTTSWTGGFRRSPEDLQSTARERWPWTAQGRAPSQLCGLAYECHDYPIDVAAPLEPGSRLHVALSYWRGRPTGDLLDVSVTTPTGAECRGSALTVATHGAAIGLQPPYSFEAIVGKGGPDRCDEYVVQGRYVVRVFGVNVVADPGTTDDGVLAKYHVSATLERPKEGADDAHLLPDLVPPVPPYDFAFGCSPLDSPPSETNGRSHEEHSDEERVCLRYSFAYGNVGDGLLDLRFDPVTTETEVPVTQVVYRADATPGRYEPDQEHDLVDAGTAHLHLSHRHWHVTDYYAADLYRVTNGRLEHASTAVKQGLCSSPWFIVDVARVRHDDPDVPSTGCDLSQANSPSLEPVRVALPANWGDFYSGDINEFGVTKGPDNFVDITGEDILEGTGQDYVLRYALNPNYTIVESDTTNNTAYAHIRITKETDGGLTVCTLERGFGDDPWAGNARVFHDELVGTKNSCSSTTADGE